MTEIEQLTTQLRILLREKSAWGGKRHLNVQEAAEMYGYTPEEIRKLAIEEGKLRFIPVGAARGHGYKKAQKKNAYQRIKFDRYKLEEDFADLTVCSRARREAIAEKKRPQRTYVNPNKHKYL